MEIKQDLVKPIEDNTIEMTAEKEYMEQRPANPEPTPQNNNLNCGSTNECEEKKKCSYGQCILMCGMILAIVGLYILHFTSNSHNLTNADATPAIVNEGGLKIAYVNTDTLLSKYEYAKDLEKELQDYQTSKENSYKQQMEKFQNDYNTYLQTGSNLTLSQQQAKEEELKQRAQKLQGLEAELTQQIAQRTLTESEKMTKAVYAFIKEYNQANQQFDLVLAKSFNNTPVLYGNPGMDITNEIVEGLNKEYAQVKKNKEK